MEHIGELIVLFNQVLIFGTAFLAYKSSRRNAAKIEEVHLSINSRMDEYLKVATIAARAEGAKEAIEKGETSGAQSRPR